MWFPHDLSSDLLEAVSKPPVLYLEIFAKC